ncbi:hypothetical protein UMNK88_pHly47 (plasmid) [Escherichia coli UMNK88]|nr:hypothetical protein UMNK88_pHly47 [Escherichia coli UMNK88]
MVIGTKIGFIRRQTLPEILCHLMNLLVGRQFLQAISTLAGCSFRPTVFQRILAALQIPAFSGRMHGNIFVLTQYTFPDELLADFTFTQPHLLLFVKFNHVHPQHLPPCRCYPDIAWQTLAGFTVPHRFFRHTQHSKTHLFGQQTGKPGDRHFQFRNNLPLAVFRADFFRQAGNTHPHGVCTGITEADQNRPDGIEEALFFRPESIFATDERPFLHVKRMPRHTHTQALLAGHRVLFHQTVIGVPELPAQRLIARRTIPGRIFTFGSGGVLATTALRALLFRFNQERGRPSRLIFFPETDLVFGGQLTPVYGVI